MTQIIGNLKEIYCPDKLIDYCIMSEGTLLDYSLMDTVKNNHSPKIANYYANLFKIWNDCNYDLSSFEWYNYYPDINYPANITKDFGNKIGIDPKRDWISEIRPGKTAPYHWDIDDEHTTWEKEGSLVRYSVFIDKPSFGHVLCIANDCLYNYDQGSIVLWDNYLDYHGAANFGTRSFYMYHCLGVRI